MKIHELIAELQKVAERLRELRTDQNWLYSIEDPLKSLERSVRETAVMIQVEYD